MMDLTGLNHQAATRLDLTPRLENYSMGPGSATGSLTHCVTSCPCDSSNMDIQDLQEKQEY